MNKAELTRADLTRTRLDWFATRTCSEILASSKLSINQETKSTRMKIWKNFPEIVKCSKREFARIGFFSFSWNIFTKYLLQRHKQIITRNLSKVLTNTNTYQESFFSSCSLKHPGICTPRCCCRFCCCCKHPHHGNVRSYEYACESDLPSIWICAEISLVPFKATNNA